MPKRSKSLDERILERLAEGELVTKLCRDEKMPSIRQLQRWRRDDAEFDDRCWSANGRGLMVQRSQYIEGMMTAIKEGGPGSSTQIQGLRELLHENGRTAGKLVSRMNDRSHLRIDANVSHQVLGWMDGFDKCPECGYEAKPNIIDGQAASPLPLAAPNNGRGYVDVPRGTDEPAPAAVPAAEKVADG
jgi:hypothetical protein